MIPLHHASPLRYTATGSIVWQLTTQEHQIMPHQMIDVREVMQGSSKTPQSFLDNPHDMRGGATATIGIQGPAEDRRRIERHHLFVLWKNKEGVKELCQRRRGREGTLVPRLYQIMIIKIADHRRQQPALSFLEKDKGYVGGSATQHVS
jgi:hypothetical protein